VDKQILNKGKQILYCILYPMGSQCNWMAVAETWWDSGVYDSFDRTLLFQIFKTEVYRESLRNEW